MAAFTAAAIGLAAAGGAMKAGAQNKANRRAADLARWNPYDVKGPGGTTTFDGTTVTGQFDPQQKAWAERFNAQGQNLLGGGAGNQGYINFANQVGNQMPGMFQGAMNASQQLPGQGFNNFNQFSGQNAQFGQQAGMGGIGQAFGAGNQMFGINEGAAQGLFQRGFGALNNTNFDGLVNQQIQAQRDFARPGEERAVNSKFQNLFNTGQLEATGGQRQIGDLAQAQEMADIQRVNSAQQFGNQLGEQNRTFGLNSIQQGFGARNQDTMANLQRMQQFGQMGQGMLGFGQNTAGAQFGSQMDFSNLINSRAQQRLSNANQQFGFGQAAQQQNLNQAFQMFGGNQQLNQSVNDRMALAANISSARGAADGKAANFISQTGGSPMGSFLGGIGQGMLGSGIGGGGGGGFSMPSFGGGGGAPMVGNNYSISSSAFGPNPFRTGG